MSALFFGPFWATKEALILKKRRFCVDQIAGEDLKSACPSFAFRVDAYLAQNMQVPFPQRP